MAKVTVGKDDILHLTSRVSADMVQRIIEAAGKRYSLGPVSTTRLGSTGIWRIELTFTPEPVQIELCEVALRLFEEQEVLVVKRDKEVVLMVDDHDEADALFEWLSEGRWISREDDES